jgi:hypothetical protein
MKEVGKEGFILIQVSEHTKINRDVINIQGGSNNEYLA